MTAASAASSLSPNVASTPRIERDIGGSGTDEESLQSFLDDLSDDVEAEMNSNDDGNLDEYNLEHAAYRTVDLLLPEKEPLKLKVLPVVITVAAISSAFFGAMALIIGAREQWLLFWVALGAVFTLGVFLNAAYRPFHILDRAWRYLCLRFSTQVGWLILGLLAWVSIG